MTSSALLVATALLVLAGLDGAFSGFRSSVGRTGLIDHRAGDRRASRYGLLLVGALLVPVITVTVVDVLARPERLAVYLRLGSGMLLAYLPYALVISAALLVYTLLSWRWKYVASAVILGPGTLARPLVAILGAVIGVVWAADLLAGGLAAAAVAAVLAVEPVADRAYGPRRDVDRTLHRRRESTSDRSAR